MPNQMMAVRTIQQFNILILRLSPCLTQEERLLIFDFGRFQIGRSLSVDVRSPETYLYQHKLMSTVPYYRRSKDDVEDVSSSIKHRYESRTTLCK